MLALVLVILAGAFVAAEVIPFWAGLICVVATELGVEHYVMKENSIVTNLLKTSPAHAKKTFFICLTDGVCLIFSTWFWMAAIQAHQGGIS